MARAPAPAPAGAPHLPAARASQDAASRAPGYRADIDGLRAVAVLGVVLYHASPRALPGGFAGVDVFFVISGYLISGILDAELRRGRFSLAGFYARRVRRIFPALALVLTAVLGYGAVLLLPSELAELGRQVAAGAGFAANLLLWHAQGYFDGGAAAWPLLHLWSLGVEEQFYLAWPMLLWGVLRSGARPLAWLAGITVVSFALNVWAAQADATADFYAPWTRLWELSAGGCLALGAARRAGRAADGAGRASGRAGCADGRAGGAPGGAGWASCGAGWAAGALVGRRARDAASVLGAGMIAGALLLLRSDMRYPGALALLPVGGSLLLLGAGPASLVGRALSARGAVAVGLVSYPLYLWHWPLLSYANILRKGRPPPPLMALALVAAALALAVLTYRLLERRVKADRRRDTCAALAVWLAAVGLTGLWLGTRGAEAGGGAAAIAKINAAIHDGVFQATAGMRVTHVDGLTLAEIGQGGHGVLLLGDSVLFQYGPRVQRLLELGRLHRTVYILAGPGCAPIPGATHPDQYARCSRMPALALRLIAEHHIEAAVLGAFWAGDYGSAASVERHGRAIPSDTKEAAAAAYANLGDFVGQIEASGAGVWLVLLPPTNRRFDPQAMIRRSLFGSSADLADMAGVPAGILRRGVAEADRQLRAVAASRGAGVLDPYPDVCGSGPVCPSLMADGAPKFADGLHLRPVFVRDGIGFLDPLLEAR